MFVKIAGVRGSGKTTITAEMQRQLTLQGINTQVIKGSELMAKYLGIDSKDLSRVPERDRITARQAIYRGLYAYDLIDPQPTVRLRDGHCAVVERDLYGGLYTSEVKLVDGDAAQLKAICLLDPQLDLIIRRRLQDREKRPERNLYDLGLLREEWNQERYIAVKQALKLDIPLYTVANDGDITQTSKQLLDWMHKDLAFELEQCREGRYREGAPRREFA